MANRTNASTAYYSYEYYLDYLDLIPVDENKLKANKHSIVIAFWVSLAAFVVLLLLLLLSMSWSASPQTRNNVQHHPTCPWSLGLNLPFCVWKQPQHHGAPQGTRRLYRARSRNQVAEHRAPSSSCIGPRPAAAAGESLYLGPPPPPRATLLSSGNWPSMGTRTAPADVRNFKPSEPPPQTEPLDGRTNNPNQGHC
ncbi:LOW QUALITY PROTEIN: melanocortin-2 receptor accessory protein [Balaenoptera ricei]|uniref:LOW QUALITY PROTEIN: melanocortin-2 receptor accessory protein n=1 Tax=Balaenoptera ricei TaxID=2746895 RepID=UPI0028BDA671|nr:LOW QUALITY PROTEIN: melanocortin-2 receptor accessory protein [Balaenoptera ricei]